MVKKNVDASFDAVLQKKPQMIEEVEEREEYIDYLNKELASYITNVIAYESNEEDSAFIGALFKATSDLERIGDHAMNICGYTKRMEEKRLSFSELAQQEILSMKETALSALKLVTRPGLSSEERLVKIAAVEQKIDDMTTQYRQNQIDRMKEGTCSNEACVLYSEMLTDFERIGDHVLNLGQQLSFTRFLTHPETEPVTV